MKKKYSYLLGSCIILMASICFFSIGKKQYFAPVPEPSVYGGYYDAPFYLTFSVPADGTIYYTTDGSIPTFNSSIYTGGIWIYNRSEEPNVYNAVQNVVTDWKDYTPDPTPVAKGTVIRAIFVNQKGIVSDVFTQTYFVGLQPPERGYTLSLVFEKDVLFGPDGIYVTGKEYDEWYLSEKEALPAPVPNFYKHLEITATAQIMDSFGEVFIQPVGLRIQGNSSRGGYKKRFIVKSVIENSGKNTFAESIFDGVSTHSIMTKGYFTDAMVFDLVADRSVSAQESVPTRVFLNGEYWYDTYLLERYDKQYFREHYNVNDVILVKDGAIDEDLTVDRDAYYEFMWWVDHTDFSDEEEWMQLTKEMDLQSYIDYISINYYLCNWDFSDYKNYVVWRSLSNDDSPYADKRWRWCIYDIDSLELTLAYYNLENAAELNIFSCVLPYSDVKVNETVLFHCLYNNSNFRQRFVISFMDIVNNNFSISKVASVLAKHGLTLDWMDGFFQKRPTYAARHLAEEFGLTGSLETVTIETAQPEMGTVQVNTSIIDLSSGTWSGKYFTDYPITVTAIPKDGYTFLGWKGASGETEPTITLPMDNGPVLEAVFAKTK